MYRHSGSRMACIRVRVILRCLALVGLSWDTSNVCAFSIGSFQFHLPDTPAGTLFLLDRRESIKAVASIAATTWISTPGSVERPAVVVTDKVAFDVRISRQDGTFYVRDDLPDIPENTVFQGRIVLGLFGIAAPNHVAKFLQYVDTKDGGPSFSRSFFARYDAVTGLVYGGTIPSLEQSELQGSAVLLYGERVLPAKLWLDSPDQSVPHRGIGLLTHASLDVTPTFGITTRVDSSSLDDGAHTVFGQLIEDTGGFLERVTGLPTYNLARPQASTLDNPNAVQGATTAVYNAQRDFFRKTAQSFGDTRVSKLYPGKLLRRVEVTRVTRL
jgi:cyclophilin family peptidyl-prolyl cis-trans isomerase